MHFYQQSRNGTEIRESAIQHRPWATLSAVEGIRLYLFVGPLFYILIISWVFAANFVPCGRHSERPQYQRPVQAFLWLRNAANPRQKHPLFDTLPTIEKSQLMSNALSLPSSAFFFLAKGAGECGGGWLDIFNLLVACLPISGRGSSALKVEHILFEKDKCIVHFDRCAKIQSSRNK